ncbi:MAG TPA: Flp pilus assembly complex ATPase component TadA [Clostridiales bacterium]|nr:Flp pilus assembly complex ATPase component TadA [Clostridiales bacterium]
MNKNNIKLGELLVSLGKLSEEQLKAVLQEQKKSNKKMGEILVAKGIISDKELIEILEFQLGIPHVDLGKYIINPEVVKLIPESMARRLGAIIVDKRGETLVVGMVNPLDIFAVDDIRLVTGHNVQPVICTEADVNRAIDKYYSEDKTKEMLEEFEESVTPEYLGDIPEEDLTDVNSAPVVKLLNSIIVQAVNMRASDIHIEPFDNIVRVRYRVDGDLQEIMTLPKSTFSAVITRIKIMGKMDIAERRVPQDGRVEMDIEGEPIDLRISVLPTVHGEKVVFRILHREAGMLLKENLGFTEENLERFEKLLMQPYGIILVTGPTGSGKSTTLYSALSDLNSMEKNIVTIEDPVEYKIKGINQVQVNIKSGMTFAAGLRSILRQDPNVIMIGEIRDAETAQIAVRAAITGHLVLSTLHTNDTASSVVRLVDMGIEPYLVSSAVVGIVSQRLVKKLCDRCKKPYEASYAEKNTLRIDTDRHVQLYAPVGCEACNKGYKGRTAVHEVMLIDEGVRRLIDKGASTDDIKNYAIKNGMTTLFDDAVLKALDGVTSTEEVLQIGYGI